MNFVTAENSLVLNLAPTGMIPTRAMSPHVPLSVSEIVEDVHAAWEVGVTMVHLHARDEADGEPTVAPEVYARIIAGIRTFAPDLVIAVSLSGRRESDPERRAAVLDLDGAAKPDMGSLTLSSLNFNREPSINPPEVIRFLASRMLECGVVPELEAFDTGMINFARYLADRGLLQAPLYMNLLLGNVACAQPDLLHLGVMLRDVPEGTVCSLAGIGAAQSRVEAIATAVGCGVRTGLEDNVWLDPGRTRLARNIDLVKRVHRLADACDRSVMRPAELRRRLRMEPGGGRFGRDTGPAGA